MWTCSSTVSQQVFFRSVLNDFNFPIHKDGGIQSGDVIEGYPSPLVGRLVGLPMATLENWRRRGFIVPAIPAKTPKPALYSFRDIIALRVAADLVRRGIPLHSLKKVVAHLHRRRGLELTATASEVLASTMLITDGSDVYEIDGGEMLVSMLRHPDQSVMLVPLGVMVAQVRADVLKVEPQTRGRRTRAKVA